MEYLWSDAWLLQAIILANDKGKGSLIDVIAAADAVNHAGICWDEMTSGLVRLSAGGYIKETDGHFVLTESVPENVRRSCLKEELSKGREVVTILLRAEEWTRDKNVRDPRNNLEYPGLTHELFMKAEKEYNRRMRKSKNELKSKN